MSPEQFVYWLRGFFEIGGTRALTQREAEIISQHLSLVFTEVAKDLPPVDKKTTPADIKKLMDEVQRKANPLGPGGETLYCQAVAPKSANNNVTRYCSAKLDGIHSCTSPATHKVCIEDNKYENRKYAWYCIEHFVERAGK